MSLQQSEMPEVSDEPRPVAGRKRKPWSLWHNWRGNWGRYGRYRNEAEARSAMAQHVRKYAWAGSWWSVENFRVLHDSAGKPS